MADRSETNTVPIRTERAGTHYVHVSHVSGDIIDVRISSPGKFINTDIGALLENIGDAIGREIGEVRARWGKE